MKVKAKNWVPVPRDRAPQWLRLPFFTRALGLELFLASGGQPIPVADDWKVSLCRTLCIEGPDRPNVCRALQRLSDMGLLRVCPGSVEVLWLVCPPSDGCPSPVCESQPDEIINNTTRQIDREIDKRERENARARDAEIELERLRQQNAANRQRPPPGDPPPELPPPEPDPSTEVWAAYEALAGAQGHPRLHADALSSLGAVCAARALQARTNVRDVATALLTAWLADDWVRKHKPPLLNLAKNVSKYLPPMAAPKPAPVKVKPPPLHPRLAALNAEYEKLLENKNLMIDDIERLKDEYHERREDIEYELRKEQQHAAAH